MGLVPDSWGSPLREFNPCHDPKTGRFANRNAGRCDPARQHEQRQIVDAVKVARQGDDKFSYLKDEIDLRRYWKRQMHKGEGIPAALLDDFKQAFKRERIVSSYDTWNPTQAISAIKRAYLNPNQVERLTNNGKESIVSAYRHEVGHVMPENFNRQRMIVGISPKKLEEDIFDHAVGSDTERRSFANQYRKTILEEIRAWRNAIKFSGGNIDFQTVQWALGTYFTGAFGGSSNVEAAASTATKHMINALRHLKRYQQTVRRDYTKRLKAAVKDEREKLANSGLSPSEQLRRARLTARRKVRASL